MKPFSKWTIEEVEDTFQIIPTEENALLKEWMMISPALSQEEESLLGRLCKKLQSRSWDWNEEELKVGFIGPLLHIVDFDQKNYRSFLERDISVTCEEGKLSGTVDFVVARGRRSPKHPLFFINEYKKEHDSSGDPLGQLMIAMVAAQKLNNDGNPLYGAYVMGRYWHFVVLDGSEYAVSLGHNAAKNDELGEIFTILKETKQIIENLLDQAEK